MLSPGGLKLLFVINPGAGPKAKPNWETIVRNYFRNLHHSIEFYLLTGKNDAASIKYWIEKINPHRIIAVGGDGTVSLLAKILLGSGIPMGILPAGSANGMAKELAIPDSVDDAMDIFFVARDRVGRQHNCVAFHHIDQRMFASSHAP